MATDIDLADLWNQISERAEVSSRAWLMRTSPVALHGSMLMAAVPDDFTRERIETRHRTWVEEQLSHHFGQPMNLALMIDPTVEVEKEKETPEVVKIEPVVETREVRLNPKYTFESFVIGESNRFAYAAAEAAAETPAKSYNPLLIYGDSGLGKTHLLHAIGHYVKKYHSHLHIKYVSTEEMTNDFINAVTNRQMDQFRTNYREVDVLLIDDIQFLEKKEETQGEFFHTFDALYNAQKQIVMTSDRPPAALETLDDRLRSRFEWGLRTDIQPPDLETRIAILRRKAQAERLFAPPDVLEFIASRTQTNIRELEGALIRVTAFASLNNQPVDLSVAETVLKDLLNGGENAMISPSVIMAQTASFFGVPQDDLRSQSRQQSLVLARQIAMYLCREMTDLSLPKVGQLFDRDHTTVIHAEKKIRKLMSERRSVYNQVSDLTHRIRQSA